MMMKLNEEDIWINERLIVKIMVKEEGEEWKVIVKMIDGENLVVCKETYWECKLYVRDMFRARESEWW